MLRCVTVSRTKNSRWCTARLRMPIINHPAQVKSECASQTHIVVVHVWAMTVRAAKFEPDVFCNNDPDN